MGEARREAMMGRQQADSILRTAVATSVAILSELACPQCGATLANTEGAPCEKCEPVRAFFEMPPRSAIVRVG